jgi:hypothetical protein
MANQNTIQITLTVKDDGSVVVQQFGKNTEDALAKTTTGAKGGTDALATLKSSWLEITAVTVAAGVAISKAMDYMELGAKAEQAEASFRALATGAHESADQILAELQRVSAGTVFNSEIMQKATKAMMLDFSGDQITQMMEMARQGARMTGEDVGQVFDKLIDSISTGMPRALRQYGLVTKEQGAVVTQAMAEGVTDVNLLSMAWSNFAVQQARLGPLMDNTAEKIQRAHAEVKKMTEEFGGEFNIAMSKAAEATDTFGGKATAAILPLETTWEVVISYVADATARLTANIADLLGQTDKAKTIRDALSGGTTPQAPGDVDAAEKAAQAYTQQLKASLGVVAQKKADLEAMKALDKDYFTSQESQIKATAALWTATGGDEYKVTGNSLKQMEALNAEYYTRTVQEIALEAAARTKAEKDKVSDVQFTAEKMKVLDAEELNRATTLEQQKTALAVQTAQNDIKNLTSQLADQQKYYDSLKVMMDKNTADEKKHIADLKAIDQQRVDNQKNMNDLIAKMTPTNTTPQQTYDAARSALNQQFMTITNTMTGQDQVKALGDYTQAVAALQAQFAKGIPGAKDIFGGIPGDILSASQVVTDATSDIDRATQMRENTLVSLADKEKQQITADQTWGQVLQGEAIKSQADMDKLKSTIFDLSTQITNMQKTIELTGVDKVSSVVQGIMAQIEQLHALAAQPITINTTMGSGSGSSGASRISPTTAPGGISTDEASWMEELANLPGMVSPDYVPNVDTGGYALGTPYVPRTGIYKLHQSEVVLNPDEAAKYRAGQMGTTIGDVHINIPAGAAPQSASDWRNITRNYIVPELRKLNN